MKEKQSPFHHNMCSAGHRKPSSPLLRGVQTACSQLHLQWANQTVKAHTEEGGLQGTKSAIFWPCFIITPKPEEDKRDGIPPRGLIPRIHIKQRLRSKERPCRVEHASERERSHSCQVTSLKNIDYSLQSMENTCLSCCSFNRSHSRLWV